MVELKKERDNGMANKSDTTQFNKTISARDILRGLSPSDFLNFGIQDVAYIRPIVIEGQGAFAIYAADGTPLSVVDNEHDAVMLAKQNDLETISIQ